MAEPRPTDLPGTAGVLAGIVDDGAPPRGRAPAPGVTSRQRLLRGGARSRSGSTTERTPGAARELGDGV